VVVMGTITLPPVITPQVVAAVEATMQRCWLELARAEQGHAPMDVQERLYQAYLSAFVAYQEAVRRLGRRDT